MIYKGEKMKEEHISLREAKLYIKNVSERIALLHLAYAKTLVNTLGEKDGLELIAKSIKEYGKLVGERVKRSVLGKGLEPIPENWSQGEDVPPFGMHDKIEFSQEGEVLKIKAYGCALAKIWREYNMDKLGRIYCYVDPIKYMSYNPSYKLIHLKTIPDGYDYCEFMITQTNERDKRLFERDKGVFDALRDIDKPLERGEK